MIGRLGGAGVAVVVVGNRGLDRCFTNKKKSGGTAWALCPTCTTLRVEVLIDEMMNRLASSPSHPERAAICPTSTPTTGTLLCPTAFSLLYTARIYLFLGYVGIHHCSKRLRTDQELGQLIDPIHNSTSKVLTAATVAVSSTVRPYMLPRFATMPLSQRELLVLS